MLSFYGLMRYLIFKSLNTLTILIINYFYLLIFLIYEMLNAFIILMSGYINFLTFMVDKMLTWPNNLILVIGISISLYWINQILKTILNRKPYIHIV